MQKVYYEKSSKNGTQFEYQTYEVEAINIEKKGKFFYIKTQGDSFKKMYLWLDKYKRISYSDSDDEKIIEIKYIIKELVQNIAKEKANPEKTKKGTLKISYQKNLIRLEADLKHYQEILKTILPNSIKLLQKLCDKKEK
jgi:hypothetical protein